MVENKIKIDGVDIYYKRKHRKYDTQHLIIVFSGFGTGGLFTYDFENVLGDCPADIIWIKDDFNKCCAYYCCKNNSFNIESSVSKFISSILNELSLTKEQCTLIGFSKGGSAAIYYGVKFGFKNILATVPQFNIGTYVKNHWPVVASNMMGDINEDSVYHLDNILNEAIENDVDIYKNIYLITSRADLQYKDEIEPNIHKLIKYRNFNLFYANSLLVTEHNQVTSYHIPLILGICYSLSQGAIPKYGCCELFGDNKIGGNNNRKEIITILKKVSTKDNVIYPEGISVIKGISCAENNDINVSMVFENELGGNIIDYQLAKAHRPSLSKVLYDSGYVNYSKGWFCSHGFNGLDLSNLPSGKYNIYLRVKCNGFEKKSRLQSESRVIKNSKFSSESIDVFLDGDKVVIIKH